MLSLIEAYPTLFKLDSNPDSLYIALSGDNLESVIKPELRKDWEIARRDWFPRTDTKENAAFDLRTPGMYCATY